MENPFVLSFGAAPTNFINRDSEYAAIKADFATEKPRSRTYVITGPRGSGKTVTLARLLDSFRLEKGVIVSRLDLGSDMLSNLAGSLYENGKAKHLFASAEFSFSFQGLGLTIKGEKPISDIRSLLIKMLEYLKKKGTRLIIAIDDVGRVDGFDEFVRTYQGFLMDGYDVCLLMTGLYENIESLSREKTLTFLKRAPKVYLDSLSQASIALSYSTVFKLPLVDAVELASFTMGYAYAYQVLGDILFRAGKTKIDASVEAEFDTMLREGAYDIVYTELTSTERQILQCVNKGCTTISEISQNLSVHPSYLAVYKDRLIKKGILCKEKGCWKFSLPRFQNYLELMSFFE